MVTMKRLVLEGEGFRTGLGCSSLAAAVVRTTEAAELCTDGVVWLSLGLWRGSGALEEIRILRETVRLLEAKIPEVIQPVLPGPFLGDAHRNG